MSAATPDYPALLRRAYVSLEKLQAKLDASERARTEPIAVIGIGCRFPGGAKTPEGFWQLLRDGVDTITEIPPDRWDVERHFDPALDVPGKMYTRWGAFLDEIDQFDPAFFGISPREASCMDPQQRLLLETAWEALENAGQAPEALSGTPTGVFLGISTNDYGHLFMKADDPGGVDGYVPTGNGFSVAAGRLSYVMGLQGPCVAVDTACSSSLVAIHLAVQSLRAGECRLALAAGVNLLLAPFITIALCQFRMMAPDGRCKTFDATADGYVRGEGCGVVALKRLSDAVTDGDTILAVIRGTATNQDGRSGGLTAPNGPAQETVIRAALANGGVAPGDVDYVEAHGSGTVLGDPIEVQALDAVLREGRATEHPVRIGSVKTNIGHLEAGAGIAGFIKAVLALHQEEIPPHLHFHRPNPHIAWGDGRITVPTAPTPWPRQERRRFAGVSSFGFGGTNAHVVLEEAPLPTSLPQAEERPLHLLALSARSEIALRELASHYAEGLRDPAAPALPDACFTANTGRSRFPHRLAVTARTAEEMASRLSLAAAGETPAGTARGHVPGGRPKIAFLFSGQGSPWAGMGQELYQTQPTYRAALDRCAELLAPHLDRPLPNILASEELLADTTYAQPVLFAVEWALAEMWRSFGVEPAAVLGHSVGEYVAATVAGVLSLEDALRLIAARGRLMGALPRNGAMAAVLAPVARVEPLVAQHASRVSIAAENAPEQTVISGERAAVEVILATLSQEGVRAQLLPVSHAFHSPLLEPMLAEFEQVAASISYANPQIRLLSNRTGQSVQPGEINARYWVEHARGAVQFRQGIETLNGLGTTTYLEVGPGATLAGLSKRCLPDAKEGTSWLTSFVRGRSEWEGMAESLGRLFVAGAEMNWHGWDQGFTRRKVSLPTYPFQRSRYWMELAPTKAATASQGIDTGNPLLGRRLPSPLEQYEAQWSVERLPGLVSSDGAAEAACRAALAEVAQREGGEVAAVEFLALLNLLPGHERVVQITVLPSGEIHLSSRAPASDGGNSADWTLHATARRVAGEAAEPWRNWLYETRWTPQPLLDQGERVDGPWLLVGEGSPLAASLAAELEAEQAPNDFFASNAPLTLAEDRRGVLYLASADAGESPASTAQRQSVEMLRLAQALAARPTHAPCRLWIVTQDAVATSQEEAHSDFGAAALWGLGRSIALELPQIWGGLVDLDAGSSPASLAAELNAVDDEDQVAYRNDVRLAPRLTRRTLEREAATGLTVRPDATYLITGGFGALGLEAARWLAEKGARRLALVGRRGTVTPEAQSMVAELEAQGIELLVLRADATVETEVARLLTELQDEARPLRGIIHAAGTLDDGVLLRQDAERFQRVLAPKVDAAWYLHQLTRELPLDFFMLCSSVAGVLGSPGQSSYAAGNAFLDALAEHRRSQGLPALSVAWGAWAGAGMAGELAAQMEARGIHPLPPERALEALDALVTSGATQAVVADIDWSRFPAVYEARGRHPLLDELRPASFHPATNGTFPNGANPKESGELLARLREARPNTRRELLASHLQGQLARVLGFDSPNAIDPSQGFFDMGMDSLRGMELKERLETDLGRPLPATVALEYATVEAMAGFLEEELRSEMPDLSASPAPVEVEETTVAADWEGLDSLSRDELLAMLQDELGALEEERSA